MLVEQVCLTQACARTHTRTAQLCGFGKSSLRPPPPQGANEEVEVQRLTVTRVAMGRGRNRSLTFRLQASLGGGHFT